MLHADKLNSLALCNNKMTDQFTPNCYIPSSLQLERESILQRDTRTSLRKPSLAVAYSKPCDPPSGIHAANCECLSFDCKGSLTLFPITSPALSFTTMNSRSFAAELPGSAGLQNARKKAVCPPTLDLTLCALVSNYQITHFCKI